MVKLYYNGDIEKEIINSMKGIERIDKRRKKGI